MIEPGSGTTPGTAKLSSCEKSLKAMFNVCEESTV